MPVTIPTVKLLAGPSAIKDANFTGGDPDIQSLIDNVGGIEALAVAAVYQRAAAETMAGGGSVTIGKFHQSFADKANTYLKQAADWRARYQGPGFTGGISQADKDSRNADPNRVPNKFYVDIDKNPLASDVNSAQKDTATPDELGGTGT